MKSIVYFLLLVLLAQGCKNAEAENNSSPEVAKNTLDWPGVYTGVLPCADCSGIKTTLTLNQNLAYILEYMYLGKGDQVMHLTGSFTWNNAGNIIRLDGIEDGPSEYLLGKNGLLQLDNNGKKITGNLADQYLLTKTAETALGYYRWKLTQLMGKYLDSKSSASLRLEVQDQRVHGFGWCNAFDGRFELQESGRVRFSDFSPTPRTCPDTTAEIQFLNMLRIVDSYELKGRELSLSRGNLPPLARFQGTLTR